MRRFYFVFLIGTFIFLAVIGSSWVRNDSRQQRRMVRIDLGGNQLSVEMARTGKELERGLSGRKTIGSDGMLFEISPRRSISFWMKGMLIPLDIVWIDDERVVGLEIKIPPPDSQGDTAFLKTYPSPQAVEYVLELPAGKVNGLGLRVGDAIEFLGSPQ